MEHDGFHALGLWVKNAEPGLNGDTNGLKGKGICSFPMEDGEKAIYLGRTDDARTARARRAGAESKTAPQDKPGAPCRGATSLWGPYGELIEVSRI
jgi:hypothetical protein